MAKKIALISLVAALSGLVSNFIDPFRHGILRAFMSIVNVSYMGQEVESGSYNYFTLVFFLMFALSAVLYWKSEFRETRLLRFSLAYIFFAKAVGFAFSVYWTIWLAFNKDLPLECLSFVFWIWNAMQIWACFKAIKFLGAQKELAEEGTNYGELTVATNIEASNWTRFFHTIFDGIVLFFAMSAPLYGVIKSVSFGGYGASASGSSLKMKLYLTIFAAQFVFYVIFEALFAATPAKFLSESRVVSDGDKPTFGNILGRTLSRFVPFDALSFLAGANWHDRWSSTEVVLEKRTGKEGKVYLWYFLGFVVLIPFLYLANAMYGNYRKHSLSEAKKSERVDYFQKRLDKLAPGDVIWLKSTSYETDYFIVAESGTPKAMDFRVVPYHNRTGERDYVYFDNLDIRKFGESYLGGEDNYETVTLSAGQLKAGIVVPGNQEAATLVFPGTTGYYAIASIDQLYAPKLRFGEVSFSNKGRYRGTASMDADKGVYAIANDGWPAKLVKITSNTGLKWRESRDAIGYPMPQKMITLEASGDDFDDVDAVFTMRDSLGRDHSYSLKSDAGQVFPELKALD